MVQHGQGAQGSSRMEEEKEEDNWQWSPLPAQGHLGCSPGLPHRTKPWWLQGLLKSAVSRAFPLSMLVSITIPALQHLWGQPCRGFSPMQLMMPSYLFTLALRDRGLLLLHGCWWMQG